MSAAERRVSLLKRFVAGVAVAAAVGVWTYRTALFGPADNAPAGAAIAAVPSTPRSVGALARLEPGDGVRRIAGPSRPTVVIGQLFIEENDSVSADQVVAVLDDYAVLESRLARLKAWLANAELEFNRRSKLFHEKTVSAADLDAARMNVEMGKADVNSAQAELELAVVRSPIAGKVLKIHARTGERVGPEGIADVGETDRMYAVAEVYETDVTRIRVGQRATITSAALPEAVHGTVERIGLSVAKQDVLHTDPAARTDARVVEVRVRVDETDQVAGLTNLEAQIAIAP